MKFKDIINTYLLTEGRTQGISEDMALRAVRNNCSDFVFDSESKLWRGVGGNPSYSWGIIRPRDHQRKSKDHADLYTTLLSRSSRWSQYPDRKKSLIAIPRERSTMAYGSPFLVIPFDGSEFAIADQADIWDSIKRSINIKVTEFQEFLGALLHEKYPKISLTSREIYADYSQIKRYFTKISFEDIAEYAPGALFDREVKKVKKEWNKHNAKNMFDLLDKIHSPENLKVSLTDYSQIPFNSKNEVWTESPCVLVEKEHVKSFIKKL